jgi:putative methyltransferase
LNERLFRIAEKLHHSGLDKLGPNFAVQSLSPVVLQNIGRRNIDDQELAMWLRRYRAAGFRTHSDLILGLPGETLQSFCAGVEKLFTLGQHAGVLFFPCSLLPNAAMAQPEYMAKHGIKTSRKLYRQLLGYVPQEEQIDEYIFFVDETATLPRRDFWKASYFMLLSQGAHGYGLLRLVAMFCHNEDIASYAAFYQRLLDFCHQNPQSLIGSTLARIEAEFVHDEKDASFEIPGLGGFGRVFENQYFFGCAAMKPDQFYAEAMQFLQQFNLDPHLLAQLLHYQRESMLLPGAAEKTLTFSYDFPAYFNAIYGGLPAKLTQKQVTLRFSHGYDLSSNERYFDIVVRLARLSDNAFYQVEYAQ